MAPNKEGNMEQEPPVYPPSPNRLTVIEVPAVGPIPNLVWNFGFSLDNSLRNAWWKLGDV